jgi:hypothetical protein
VKHDSDILKRIKNYFMRRKSAKEAHQFEREIEKDAFLYEAMEGFEEMMASDIQQSLDELDDMLDDKVGKRFAFHWWQAAAVGGVVIIGASIMLLTGGNESPGISPSVAEEEEQVEEILVPDEVVTVEDTLNAVAVMDESDYGNAPQSMDYEAEANLISSPAEEAVVTLSDEIVTAGYSDEAARSDNLGSQAEPVEEEIAVLTEDLESLASDEAPGYSREVLEKSEVQPSAAKSMERRVSESQDVLQAAPIGGMTAYMSYLKSNIKTSDGMPNGFVTLSFEFERDGSPKKITINKSLCTACDAEAIRLVKVGPKWNAPNRKERMTIQVQFP